MDTSANIGKQKKRTVERLVYNMLVGSLKLVFEENTIILVLTVFLKL